MGKKLVDYVIGNPPYQDNTLGDNDTYAPPVYHLFMNASYQVSDKVEMITPARFLFNAGSTPKEWNKKMLNDKHFKVLFHEQDSSKVFANTDIKGGVAITYRDEKKDYGAIEIFTPYDSLNSILHKVLESNFTGMSTIIESAYSYHLTQKVYDDNPELFTRLSKGHEYDLKSNVFDLLPEIFLDIDTNLNSADYVKVLGRQNNKRYYKLIKKDYLVKTKNFEKFKVFIPGASGTGAIGETLATPIVGEPLTGTTESFLSIGSFEKESESENCIKYIKTKFARVMFAILKVTQAITPGKWAYVPLQDFTENSDIDWSKSVAEIDRQLYKKYGLTQEEIDFIETHVKEMA